MRYKVGDILLWEYGIDNEYVIVVEVYPNLMRYKVTDPGGGFTWEVSEEYLSEITEEDELYLF